MRYYWLKLREDFFRDIRVKALRRCENGDTLALLYLQLLLSALETGGVLPLMGVDGPAAEIALLLDITEDTAAALLAALSRFELLLQKEDDGLYLPAVEALTGSECESASRMRRQRVKKEPDAAGSSAASHCAHNVQNCDTEIEIEKEIEKEIEPEPEREREPESETEKESPRHTSPSSSGFSLPTKEKKKYVVGDEKIKVYAALWPELDMNTEFSAMQSWLQANPERRKTLAQTPRFVYGWLSRAHDKARASPAERQQAPCSPEQREPQRRENRYADGSYAPPPSYDMEKAMEEMMTGRPKVQKRQRR